MKYTKNSLKLQFFSLENSPPLFINLPLTVDFSITLALDIMLSLLRKNIYLFEDLIYFCHFVTSLVFHHLQLLLIYWVGVWCPSFPQLSLTNTCTDCSAHASGGGIRCGVQPKYSSHSESTFCFPLKQDNNVSWVLFIIHRSFSWKLKSPLFTFIGFLMGIFIKIKWKFAHW